MKKAFLSWKHFTCLISAEENSYQASCYQERLVVKCSLQRFWSHLMVSGRLGEGAGSPVEPTVQVPSKQANPSDPHSYSWFSLGCIATQSVHPASWRHAAPEDHRLVPGRTPKNRGVCEDGASSRSQYPRLRGVVGTPVPLPSQLSQLKERW